MCKKLDPGKTLSKIILTLKFFIEKITSLWLTTQFKVEKYKIQGGFFLDLSESEGEGAQRSVYEARSFHIRQVCRQLGQRPLPRDFCATF